MNIKTFGPVDERSLKQLERCMTAGDAEYGVLCAEHHPGYSQPIGGAVAYEGYVSPSGVSYDIGCGNKAVKTGLTRADKVLEILSADAVHEVHNHHNFAWREEHLGRTYWVIRKGCAPARPARRASSAAPWAVSQ
jgi:RNA-splicing ligase RtcB